MAGFSGIRKLKAATLLGLASAISLICLYCSHIAGAHELQEDHGISAVMHVTPEDNPIANKPTKLDFFFADDANKLRLTDCNCQLTVIYNNHIIQQEAISGNALTATAWVTFPGRGNYDILVSGHAAHNQFPPFSLTYPQQVTSSASAATPKPSSDNTSIIALVIAICIVSLTIAGLKARHDYIDVQKTDFHK